MALRYLEKLNNPRVWNTVYNREHNKLVFLYVCKTITLDEVF